MKPEINRAWGLVLPVIAQPKSGNRDWIIIALLILISDAGNQRRWQVPSLISTFPYTCQGKLTQGRNGKEHTQGVLVMCSLGI